MRVDLTKLLEGRVHLTGFDCAQLRALRALQAAFHPLNMGSTVIEFWQTSNTNPAKVNCVNCWRENPAVRATFTPYVVIKLRGGPK